MFWVLFIAIIFIGCAVVWLAEFFQQMKTSEYEEVRMIYWFLVIAFWVTILVWAWSWQGKQVGGTSKNKFGFIKKGCYINSISKNK